MAQPETYVLGRNPQESQLLNSQHEFFRLLCHGHLIHPSIPQNEVQAIADVGTGTGVWLQQVAQSFPGQKRELVGFDISSLQFPTSEKDPDGLSFVVHDMTHPFPKEYHGKFDLVHVRFLSYGLKQQELKATVENLTEILRPGGYIQWQEIENADVWTIPSTLSSHQAIMIMTREKMDRGLIVCCVSGFIPGANPGPGIGSTSTEIIKTMFSLSIPSAGNVGSLHATGSLTKFNPSNPVSWTNNLLRVFIMDTYSTHKHPSPDIQVQRGATRFSAHKDILRAIAARKRAMATDAEMTSEDKNQLIKEADENERLAEAVESEINGGAVSYDATLTWIVARKATIVDKDQDWMTAVHTTAEDEV